jgi:8-oxo-dGTP pyrophosphatase MutT (NUDIX family)
MMTAQSMKTAMHIISQEPDSLIPLIQKRLHQHLPESFDFNTNGNLGRISAVLFLLGRGPNGDLVLILNKRSRRVRQSGDLCCPGGGISPTLDALIAEGLNLPVTPLWRWPYRPWWRRHRKVDFPKLSLLLAAALREGLEEMRLNPLGVTFLGPMPVQQLVMFKRDIYPMVGWVNRQNRFFPNREVEKIVRIPMAAFFNPGNYFRFRISFKALANAPNLQNRDMPCFLYRHNGEDELLWGATYRITEQFLRTILDYVPPAMESLPVIHRRLDRHYLSGSSTNG